jgi:protein-disulfide isomerase
MVFALLVCMIGFSAAYAQGEPDHGDGGFTLPNIAQGLFDDAAETLRGLWQLSGATSAASVSPYTSLPNSRTEDGGFVLGEPDAPVTLVVFADFGCPHCQTYETTVAQFVDAYVATGMARFENRTFPTAGGANTEFAGKVQECVDQQRSGAYWEAYVLYYSLAMNGRFNNDAHRAVVDELGLNYNDVLGCTESAGQVRTDVTLGVNSGVSGTPAVMIRVGDGAPQWIEYQGVVYNRGGVPFDVLAAVVELYQ